MLERLLLNFERSLVVELVQAVEQLRWYVEGLEARLTLCDVVELLARRLDGRRACEFVDTRAAFVVESRLATTKAGLVIWRKSRRRAVGTIEAFEGVSGTVERTPFLLVVLAIRRPFVVVVEQILESRLMPDERLDVAGVVVCESDKCGSCEASELTLSTYDLNIDAARSGNAQALQEIRDGANFFCLFDSL